MHAYMCVHEYRCVHIYSMCTCMIDVMHASNMLSIYCIYLICCICVGILSHLQLFSYTHEL